MTSLPRRAFSGPDSGCGSPQDLSEESGTFSSMNYPNNYDDGKTCSWHITVDPDKVRTIISGFQKRTDLCVAKSWRQTFGQMATFSPSLFLTLLPKGFFFFFYIHTESTCWVTLTDNSAISPGDRKQRRMKHVIGFLLQVIHLWFEDFDLEETQLCMRDFITLQDSLGIIGKSGINADLMEKGSRRSAFVNTQLLFNCLFLMAVEFHTNAPCAVCR